MTTAIVLNIILAATIFVTIVGLLSWAIATQSRNDGPPIIARRRRPERRAPATRPSARHAERRHSHRGSLTA